MFKLKSKFITASLVVFGILFSITGCNKDEIPESTETNSESIVDAYTTYANQSLMQYSTNSSKLTWIEKGKIALADAKGAIDGAKNSDITYLPPPWNKIAGGITGGAVASYKKYLELTGTPPAAPPPPPPTAYSNPNNAYENAGVCHNLALWECVVAGVPNDLVIMYNTIATDIQNITFNNVTTNDLYMTLPLGVYTSLYTLNNPYPFPTYEENDLFMDLINFTDPVEASILANYFHNMFLIVNLQDCIDYSIAMEDFITGSTMNPDNKENILIAMAVFRNSINFWN